jgi:hypothetical protein
VRRRHTLGHRPDYMKRLARLTGQAQRCAQKAASGLSILKATCCPSGLAARPEPSLRRARETGGGREWPALSSFRAQPSHGPYSRLFTGPKRAALIRSFNCDLSERPSIARELTSLPSCFNPFLYGQRSQPARIWLTEMHPLILKPSDPWRSGPTATK